MMKKYIFVLAAAFAIVMAVNANVNSSMETKVRIGETKELGGSGLTATFVRVVEDSRCPEGADCIWAGRILIELELKNAAGKTCSFQLQPSEQRNVAEFDGRNIILVSVTPHPKVNTEMNKDAYEATINVGPSTE